MKLSKYIKKLQKIQIKHGDLECIYATDPEGNAFYTLDTNPSVSWVIISEGGYSVELLDEDDNDATLVCVVN